MADNPLREATPRETAAPEPHPRPCRRCGCIACLSGYENHEHVCTRGPGCVEEKRRGK
jgi:hypothetical protein